MGQSDESPRALRQCFSLQIRPAEFGDDDMGVVTGGGDGTMQVGDDAGNRAAFRGRVAGDDGAAALGGVSAADEIELAAGGAELAGPEALGIAGTLQIDLQGGVYRGGFRGSGFRA
jgi:hypothetical protein